MMIVAITHTTSRHTTSTTTGTTTTLRVVSGVPILCGVLSREALLFTICDCVAAVVEALIVTVCDSVAAVEQQNVIHSMSISLIYLRALM